MRRGEVWWAELAPRSGAEQQGRCPVIVVSHGAFNAAPGWRSMIVVPVSTAPRQMRRGPTAVAIGQGEGGLPQPSVALCHQVTTLDRARLVARLGALGEGALAAVESGIKTALDLR
jgi:mRNA interferase MazF